ncbi:hypothetical protein [Kitasatospora sp. MAP5-34]|uniref:hypothetical protein n=1 Tax=Kitasatospora sp. MAP5-34 TaxID=3035102 RepID=UPI0024754DAA|nr:hypothetical protein [Kitasatospora sp. MAP5-34]MDH6579117.1 hypothetical protein [Kitasatospora sp. MAP5-34]
MAFAVILGTLLALIVLAAVIEEKIPPDWRHKSQRIVRSRSERGLRREVRRIIRARGFERLFLVATPEGAIGLTAEGSSHSLRLRTVRRRVLGTCSYCVIEGVIETLPVRFKPDEPDRLAVIQEYRQLMTTQPGPVQACVHHTRYGWSADVAPFVSSAPLRYRGSSCTVHAHVTRKY